MRFNEESIGVAPMTAVVDLRYGSKVASVSWKMQSRTAPR